MLCGAAEEERSEDEVMIAQRRNNIATDRMTVTRVTPSSLAWLRPPPVAKSCLTSDSIVLGLCIFMVCMDDTSTPNRHKEQRLKHHSRPLCLSCQVCMEEQISSLQMMQYRTKSVDQCWGGSSQLTALDINGLRWHTMMILWHAEK